MLRKHTHAHTQTHIEIHNRCCGCSSEKAHNTGAGNNCSIISGVLSTYCCIYPHTNTHACMNPGRHATYRVINVHVFGALGECGERGNTQWRLQAPTHFRLQRNNNNTHSQRLACSHCVTLPIVVFAAI